MSIWSSVRYDDKLYRIPERDNYTGEPEEPRRYWYGFYVQTAVPWHEQIQFTLERHDEHDRYELMGKTYPKVTEVCCQLTLNEARDLIASLQEAVARYPQEAE